MSKTGLSNLMHPFLTTLFLLLFAFRAFAEEPCSEAPQFAGIQDEYAEQFNRLRQRNSLNYLSYSENLGEIAARYACLLARTDHFDHTGPYGSTLIDRAKAGGYAYCSIAENLAKGQRSVSRVLIDWSNSPGHYANLMRKGVVEFGLGLAIAKVDAPEGDAAILTLSDLARQADGKTAKPDPAQLPDGKLVWVLLLGREC